MAISRIRVSICQVLTQPGSLKTLLADITYFSDEQSFISQPDGGEETPKVKLCVQLPNGDSHPTHGLRWRQVVRGIRNMVSDGSSEGTGLNKLRTLGALCSGDGPRYASFPVILPHEYVDDLLSRNGEKVSPRSIELRVSTPPEYSQLDLVDVLGELGYEFGVQAQSNHSQVDMTTSIFLLWLSANAAYEDLEARLVALRELSSALLQRFRLFNVPSGETSEDDHLSLFQPRPHLSGQQDDVHWGISLLCSTLDVCPVVHSERLELLVTLTNWFQYGLPYCGITEDFDNAIKWCRKNVLPSPPQHAILLNRLGYPFMYRYESLGHIEDLDAVVLLLRCALNLTSPDHPNRVDCLYNLVVQARTRFDVLRYSQDQEDALAYGREALSLIDAGVGTVSRALILYEQGLVLGMDGNIDEGIPILREALVTVDPVKERETSLRITIILYRSLYSRYERDGVQEDLQEAINMVSQAIEEFSGPQDMRVHMILDAVDILSNPQATKLDSSKNWYEQVIHLAREALQLLAPDKRRHIAHANLSKALMERYDRLHDANDAQEAYENIQAAIAIANRVQTAAQNRRAYYLAALARIELNSFTQYYNVSSGLQHIRDCLNDDSCSAKARLHCINQLFRTLDKNTGNVIVRTHLNEFADIHLIVIRLLPQVAYIGLSPKMRVKALKPWEPMIAEAAAVCLFADKAKEAIEIIEEGKILFWSESLRLRTPCDDLPQEYRDQLFALFRRVEEASRTPMTIQPENNPGKSAKPLTGDELPKLLKEIRSLPGHESFMQPPSFERLVNSARRGPVVLLIPQTTACFALCIVSEGARSFDYTVRQLRLHKVPSTLLQKWVRHLHANNSKTRSSQTPDSMSHNDRSDDGEDVETSHHRDERAGRLGGSKMTSELVMKEMWLQVVKPILDALELQPTSGRSRPRLWWSPSGILARLPLHAAGIHTKGKLGPCCSDYVVSSYTPTLGALVSAHDHFRPNNVTIEDDGLVVADYLYLRQEFKVLSAAVPTPFKGDKLPGVITELEAVASLIPAECLIPLPREEDVLHDPTASVTASTVKELLPEASVLHLACHGLQNTNNPLDSGFIMRDKMFTIADLMSLSLPHAVLAFLSACETAKGDEALPNQSIHLCAALLFTGFKSVVGTMWPMDDRDGPRVAKAIYGEIFRNWKKGTSENVDLDTIAYTLDEVSQTMRAEGLPMSRWAQYVHYGV